MPSQSLVQVTSHLWIGSYPYTLPIHFHKLAVCSLEPLMIERDFPHSTTIYAPLTPRVPTAEDARVAVQIGRAVAGWLRKEQRVLVCCSTGQHRAAFVAAIALMTRGQNAAEAILTIRKADPDALNEDFVHMLRRLEQARAFELQSHHA